MKATRGHFLPSVINLSVGVVTPAISVTIACTNTAARNWTSFNGATNHHLEPAAAPQKFFELIK